MFLILIVLIILLFPSFAAASTSEPHGMGFFFIQDIELTAQNAEWFNVLLLCNAAIDEPLSGIVLSIGGSVTVRSEVDGIILTLFTKTLSTAPVKYGIINLKTLCIPIDLIFGLAFLAIFKDFSEQSAGYFQKQRRSVFKFGLYGYIMALLLIGIFLVSIAGAVIAIAGLALLLVISACGQVPIAIVLGYALLHNWVPRYNVYMLFAVGVFLIDLLKLVPGLGDVVMFGILPYLSLGIFSVYVIHKYFYRHYVFASFEKGMQPSFDRKKMDEIILKKPHNNRED